MSFKLTENSSCVEMNMIREDTNHGKGRLYILLFVILVTRLAEAQVNQIVINRILQMPNSPSPYMMRDWNQVAIGYDNLVYDISKTGDYLPLIFINDTGVNYPQNKSFGLDTYVGTFSSNSGEAINVLPALIGATLVGIDKSNQNSTNWVLMGQDFLILLRVPLWRTRRCGLIPRPSGLEITMFA